MAQHHQALIKAGMLIARRVMWNYGHWVGGDHQMLDYRRTNGDFTDAVVETRGIMYYFSRHAAVGLFNLRPAAGSKVKCTAGGSREVSRKPISEDIATIPNRLDEPLPIKRKLTDLQIEKQVESTEVAVEAYARFHQQLQYGSEAAQIKGTTDFEASFTASYKNAKEKTLERQHGDEREYGPIHVPVGHAYKITRKHTEIKVEQDFVFEGELDFDVHVFCDCHGRGSSGWGFTVPGGRDGFELFLRGIFTDKRPDGWFVDWHFNFFQENPAPKDVIHQITSIPLIARVVQPEVIPSVDNQEYAFEQIKL